MKVATTCLQWSQPIFSHSPSSSQTLASAISTPSSKRRNRRDGGDLVCRYVRRLDRSAFFGIPCTKLCRSRSFEYPKSRAQTIKRACSAGLDSFSDEEFSKRIEELALRFQLYDEDDSSTNSAMDAESEMVSDSIDTDACNTGDSVTEISSKINFAQKHRLFPSAQLEPVEPPWPEIRQDPPDWAGRDEIVPANIERKANSVDLPLSLRIIKRKKQWQEGFREVGESAYCSVKKAFSSMVFIIREIHSFSLHMRENIFYQDLQGILDRVEKEMHASFVWLFQQVFSPTPTLMVYVMILLANFTVYSMANTTAIAASPPPGIYAATTTESVLMSDSQHDKQQNFDSSIIKKFSVSSSNGKAISIGNNGGGGGKPRPTASGADGDGRFDRSEFPQTFLPDGVSQVSIGTTRESESVSGDVTREEVALWNSMVEEASKMQAALRDDSLDHETMQSFVSPVKAKIEADDYADYFRTELLYQIGLAQEPNNPLLLANYAQFLYLVALDYDR